MQLIEGIRAQEVDNECEIDFGDIGNGKTATENKYYWEKLKKLASSRLARNVSDLLRDLFAYFKAQGVSAKYHYPKSAEPEPERRVERGVNKYSLLELFNSQ